MSSDAGSLIHGWGNPTLSQLLIQTRKFLDLGNAALDRIHSKRPNRDILCLVDSESHLGALPEPSS
jgi:hypothetical protein